jgi:catalase-peroxidase
MADMIVLGGCAAVEEAARKAGHQVTVPFTPGRTDATAEMTDAASFEYLRPHTDGFRNYVGKEHFRRPAVELVDRANQLSLTAPEMTVLVGGLRVLGANYRDTNLGVFTDRVGVLSNDWFVNLLDMGTEWKKAGSDEYRYEGYDRQTGKPKWTASSVDLVFGSNSQLRALAEVYASDDGGRRFVEDFVAAWDKVMNLDRFEVKRKAYAGGAETRSEM